MRKSTWTAASSGPAAQTDLEYLGVIWSVKVSGKGGPYGFCSRASSGGHNGWSAIAAIAATGQKTMI